MAAKRNIEITIGEDYSHKVIIEEKIAGVWTPVDITGRSYSAMLKKSKTQAVPDATFTFVLTDPTNGEFTLYLDSAATSLLDVGCYKWDVWQDAEGTANPLFGGEANVVMGVSV